MWPFHNIDKLDSAGILRGFTDWHSHILPGVDDGIRKIEDSLAVLRRYEEGGVKRVWLTPHIMEDYPNDTTALKEKFEMLKEAYTGPVELRLASENMLDALFEERLEKNDFLPIGEEGRHLLVETSYMNPPFGMEEMMEGAMQAGYTLVLAHPERYRYMDENDYFDLKDKGILFQTNMISLVGGYGDVAQRKAEWLLKEGMVDLTGSDLHRLNFFNDAIHRSPRKKHSLQSILDIAANPAID